MVAEVEHKRYQLWDICQLASPNQHVKDLGHATTRSKGCTVLGLVRGVVEHTQHQLCPLVLRQHVHHLRQHVWKWSTILRTATHPRYHAKLDHFSAHCRVK